MDGRSLDEPAWPQAEVSLGDELLRPSEIYSPTVLRAFRQFEIHGAAHITGGGLAGNLNRVINENVDAQIDVTRWRRPRVFDQIAAEGPVSEYEMRKVFNIGIGMVLVAPREQSDLIIEMAHQDGHEAWIIGQILQGNGEVRWADE